MAKVVMLTALAGEGIDIVANDVCECSTDQANRFLAYGYAREYREEQDSKRPVKSLQAPTKTADPPQTPPSQDEPQTNTNKPRRKRSKKDASDANDSKGEEA